MYDEFYNESSEFIEQIEGLKSELFKSVKKEIIDELLELREELRELRPVRDNISRLERDYNNKKAQLEREYEEKKRNIRRERISELFKDSKIEYWTTGWSYEEKEKCDKCDEDRRIHYKTPLGNKTWESCDCDERITNYIPKSILLNTFSFRDGTENAWYKVRDEGSRDEYLEFHDSSIFKEGNLITDESQINKKVDTYRTMFETKELAQKFCNLKNEEKKQKPIGADEIAFELEEIEDDGIKKRKKR